MTLPRRPRRTDLAKALRPWSLALIRAEPARHDGVKWRVFRGARLVHQFRCLRDIQSWIDRGDIEWSLARQRNTTTA